MTAFIECESLNINYNTMGIATVNYTIISDNSGKNAVFSSISAGGTDFNGIVTTVHRQPIPNTENADGGPWYTTNVTLLSSG